MNRTGLSIAGLVLVILLFCGIFACAEVTLTAMTWPPGQKMKPGVSVMIQVRGMEQPDEGAKQPKTKWHIIPALEDDATMLFRDMDGQPLLFFAGGQAGPRTVFLQIESPGLDELPRCDFEYGEKEDEDDSDEDEDDEDESSDPIEGMWVIVVEESRNRTSPQAQVLLDFSLRNWLEKNGHHFRLVDKDQPAKDLSAWIAQAEAHDLPRLFLVGEDGKAVFEGPLPETKTEMHELVKEWGAEK